MKRGRQPGDLFVTKELARRIMNEMDSAAGQAYDRRMAIFFPFRHTREPVLHVHPGVRAFV
jgi:hypothetical protein